MYVTGSVLLITCSDKKNWIWGELKSKKLAWFKVQYLNCNILGSFCMSCASVVLLLYFACASKTPVCLFYITKM